MDKGKVERVFQTIQMGFETTLSLPQERVTSIRELNEKLSNWIQENYHLREHSSTGVSPQVRFIDGCESLRQTELSHQALDKLFYTRVERTVRKNGTIRIENKFYEVDLSLRGQRVELRYDPFRSVTVMEVYKKNRYMGEARAVNLNLNSQIHDRRNYERNEN